MHGAPAVVYPVGRSSFQGVFLLVFCAVGLSVGGLWALSMPAVGACLFVFFVILIVVFLLASCAWWQTDIGRLAWGGESWVWTSFNVSITGSIAVHFDVQSLLIVRLKDEEGRSIWLWVERASDPACWPALRRAVYAEKKVVAVTEVVKAEVSL